MSINREGGGIHLYRLNIRRYSHVNASHIEGGKEQILFLCNSYDESRRYIKPLFFSRAHTHTHTHTHTLSLSLSLSLEREREREREREGKRKCTSRLKVPRTSHTATCALLLEISASSDLHV